MTNWIITSHSNIANLRELAAKHGGETIVVALGNVPVSSDLRIDVDATTPIEAYAPAVAAAVTAGDGDAVFAPDTAAERVLAGAIAAKLGAPVLSAVVEISADSASVSRYGGLSLETVSLTKPVVIIVDGGASDASVAEAKESRTGDAYAATVVETTDNAGESVNLSVAPRVVAAGRGFAAASDLDLARDLADALGAEFGVSRPLAEGYGWVPRDLYIGVSGQVIAPELYVAAGISGQIHHTAGVVDSEVIVAINDDELATIFDFADYGIVGDLYEVLPALTQALRECQRAS